MLKTSILACGLAIAVLAADTRQQRPDFSGTWILIESLTNSSRGSSGASGGMARTSANTAGGAAFNCGAGCVITQKGPTLTIEKAQLADYAGKDTSKPTPSITFRLDGQETRLVNTFSPSQTLMATARWVDDTIQIATAGDEYISRSQRLTMEGKHLIVTTTTNVVSKPEPGILVHKYARK